MTEVISIRFKNGGKDYFFDPDGNKVKVGDKIIVEMQRGKEMGTVSEINHEVDDDRIGATAKEDISLIKAKL